MGSEFPVLMVCFLYICYIEDGEVCIGSENPSGGRTVGSGKVITIVE